MKVLVTGANGFVGSHVAERFAGKDVEIRLLLRRTSNLGYLKDVRYERAEGDLRDVDSLRRAVDGVDTVIHAGGLTSALTEGQYHEVNAHGTARLVAAARDAGVRRFVYVSSLAALGPSTDGRTPAQPHPISAYGRSKLAGEYPVLAEREAMSVVIIRPPVVYGPRDRALLPFYRIARFGILPVYGDGNHRLTWIHVHDCADAIITAALGSPASGAAYTISDGETYTWRRLVELYGNAIGRKVRVLPIPGLLFQAAGYAGGAAQAVVRRPLPLTPDEVGHMRMAAWIGDHEAITRDLGWQPRIRVAEGFVLNDRWYKEQGWL